MMDSDRENFVTRFHANIMDSRLKIDVTLDENSFERIRILVCIWKGARCGISPIFQPMILKA